MMRHKKQILALAVLGLMGSAAWAQQAFAQDGAFMVRARAVRLVSDNGDTTGLGLKINDKTIPEVDVSYFFNPNFALELILTYPQKHNLSSNGARIGTLKHLPPTLLAQYHFNLGPVKPYVGAGLNYTRFSNIRILDGAATVDKNSFGPALQVGLDVPLDKNWSINVDVKKVWIRTDVKVGGNKVGKFKADPVLVGLGVGYRF